MSQRANLIKCAGLVTHGSELSVKEGSLRQATNVNIDEDGVITSRRGFNDYGNATDDISEKRVKQLMEYKERLFRHFEDQIQFEDENGLFQDIAGSYSELRSGYRIKWKETKGNLYFTTEEGIKRISLKNNSTLTSTSNVIIDQAGVPKAAYLEGDYEEKLDGFLPPQSKVSYRFIFGRKDSNNNLLLGSPSARHIVTNTNDRTVINETATVSITQSSDPGDRYVILDSDYIVVPSKNTKTTFYFKRSTGSVSKPQKADTIGSTFVEVDISNAYNPNLVINDLFDTGTDYVVGDIVTYDDGATVWNYECIQDTTPGTPELPSDILFWTPQLYDGLADSPYNDDVAGILANEMSANLANYDITLSSSTITLTSTEEGNIDDIVVDMTETGSGSEKPVESVNNDGSVVEGNDANVRLKLIVPPTITDDYFIQLYRTAFFTKPDTLELSDIDPGDENNLVYEANVTLDDISLGEIEVYDDRPETFRASGAPLYTNEITGEGILQANDPPPIALDVDLFRNSMFYANTKSSHKSEISIISVDDFESSKTRLIVSNSEKTRYYTFVGTSQKTDVIINGTPSNGDYFNLNSTNDKSKYYIWFDSVGDGSGDPVLSDAKGYVIDVSDSPTTGEISSRIENALFQNIDFDVTSNLNVVNFANTDNGYTTGLTAGTSLNNVVINTPSVYGSGELSGTEEGGDVLLSGSTSTSLSIDETARSIVKIINKDVNSIVNAFYLSGADDIPGNILFEARDLTDDTFHIAIESGYDEYVDNATYSENDKVRDDGKDYKRIKAGNGIEPPTDPTVWEIFNIEKELTPDLSKSNPITRIVGATTGTNITVEDHGYATGQTIRVNYTSEDDPEKYDSDTTYNTGDKVTYGKHCYESLQNSNTELPPINPSSSTEWDYLYPSSFAGNYEITVQDDDIFTISYTLLSSIDSGAGGSVFSLDRTAAFESILESDNLEIQNRLYYSKSDEPEAVPAANYIDVGAKDDEISRIISLRDNLFVLKGDGIYIVSGTSAPDFSVRLLDNTRILAPDSAVVLNNQIYCLTEQGITVVTDSGAGVISRGIENLVDAIINAKYDYVPNTFGVSYENDRSYILFAPSEEGDTSATQAYRYNIFERTWSRWEYSAGCGHVMERDNRLYVGNGDRNFVSQERKNFDRTDNCDRDFDLFISSRGVTGLEVELSSTDDVEIHDVLVQEQEVSVNYVNRRLLVKMDKLDTGLELGGSADTSDPVMLTSTYPHLLQDLSTWTFKVTYKNQQNQEITELRDYVVNKINDYQFSIDYDNSDNSLLNLDIKDFYTKNFYVETGDDITDNLNSLNTYLNLRDPAQYQGPDYLYGISSKTINLDNMLESVNTLVDELNTFETITSLKDYKKPEKVTYEAYITDIDYRGNLVYIHTERPFLQQDITVHKRIKKIVEWNPQHFGDPSAVKQIRSVTILFDQNNFSIARAKFASDVSQSLSEVPITGKGIAYFGDMNWDNPDSYWGGQGNDVPFRTVVPREKQKCRYLTMVFEHINAREEFKVLGITGVVRPISSRGYK